MLPLLGLALFLWVLVSLASSHIEESRHPHLQTHFIDRTWHTAGDPDAQARGPECTADELLPSPVEDLQYHWAPLADGETRPLEYNCTCRFTKASYFCPHGRTDYPSWVPKVVANGECSAVGKDVLDRDPFPPGRSYLFYGNSHLRQVVEAIMCAHQHLVVRREACLALGEDRANQTVAEVAIDQQCRGCMRGWSDTLSRNGCVTKDEVELALRCGDDRAVYGLDNNSTVHYFFANDEVNKSLEDSLQHFGTSFSDYAVVFANVGNDPIMHTSRVISAAQHLDEVGVPLLWLSTYDGEGDVQDWSAEDRRAFDGASGRYIPVHDMMNTMRGFTRGVAEDRHDDHFCLPGPPNELGLLALRLIWALHIDGRSV